jgi:hypothetical protein
LGPLGTTATNRTILPAPNDYDYGKIGGMISRGNGSTRKKTCPSAALSTTNPTCCPDENPGLLGGKPATNRLSYGTALYLQLLILTSPSNWPRGLKHELSSLARKLDSWVESHRRHGCLCVFILFLLFFFV